MLRVRSLQHTTHADGIRDFQEPVGIVPDINQGKGERRFVIHVPVVAVQELNAAIHQRKARSSSPHEQS